TTSQQKVIIGNLDGLPELVIQHDVKPPTLVIVGEVVKLHNRLHWFNPESDVSATAIRFFGGRFRL
ncbi:MAG: hypothetical protein OXK72_07340, partial [Gammaproteobacteria bacterium]|nr:hypothetical protein [Gammaproteobacteria bacterium]